MDIRGLQQRASATRNASRCIFNCTCRVPVPARTQLRLARCRAVIGPDGTAEPALTDVENILRQHKALIESGFSYDQASLILQVTQRRITSSTCTDLPSLQLHNASTTAAVPEQQPMAHGTSSSSNSNGDIGPLAAPEQQQQYLKSLEDRLSFLEMELLKQAVVSSTQYLEPPQLPALGASATVGSAFVNPHSRLAAGAGSENAAWVAEIPQLSLRGKADMLDPEVLAIAQALLIRKGLPYSADTFASSSSERQQQQQQNIAPSSIWGRRAAMRQLRAKPWRYREEDDCEPAPPRLSPADRTVMKGSLLHYGYQPNYDASIGRNGRSSSIHRHAGGVLDEGLSSPKEQAAELAPYEPSAWTVVGTVLVVYAGILLTFFAVVAGTADGSGAIDPADLAMMMW